MTTFTNDIEANLPDVYVLAPKSANPEAVSDAVAKSAVLIETVSGVFLKAEEREMAVSVTDAAWIRKAIVFQSAWLLEHPEAFNQQAFSSVSQDGVSVSAPNELTFVLAPLAKRALKQCSWAKHGTLRVAPATDRTLVTDPTVSDAHGGWVTL